MATGEVTRSLVVIRVTTVPGSVNPCHPCKAVEAPLFFTLTTRLEEVGKELDRYKEESSKSHESEGGSHPSVVHRQPAFTYLHCLPHPPQDTRFPESCDEIHRQMRNPPFSKE
ncbi:hypothetical protein GWK47_038782 [Chionoecetes opilio]|uniref:Uncharacterized protein n=1 Tax=Chionoecetes opilio TaxID=41210 RepID=A0A8J4YEY9_CHIOP|nr:hypothetical protein GWK47_038782 [Chionoecetes opilio]